MRTFQLVQQHAGTKCSLYQLFVPNPENLSNHRLFSPQQSYMQIHVRMGCVVECIPNKAHVCTLFSREPIHLRASLCIVTHTLSYSSLHNYEQFCCYIDTSKQVLSLLSLLSLSLSSLSLLSLSLSHSLSLSSPCNRSHARSYHRPHGEGHSQREPVSDACVGRGRQAALHGLPEGPRQTHLLPTLRQTSAALFSHLPHHYKGIHCECARQAGTPWGFFLFQLAYMYMYQCTCSWGKGSVMLQYSSAAVNTNLNEPPSILG